MNRNVLIVYEMITYIFYVEPSLMEWLLSVFNIHPDLRVYHICTCKFLTKSTELTEESSTLTEIDTYLRLQIFNGCIQLTIRIHGHWMSIANFLGTKKLIKWDEMIPPSERKCEYAFAKDHACGCSRMLPLYISIIKLI